MFALVMLGLLALLFMIALPIFPYSRGWSYLPPGGIGVAMIVIAVLAVQGRL